MALKLLIPKSKLSKIDYRHFCVKSSATTKLGKDNSLNHSAGQATHYDVVIAGGGLVGTTLACALGKSRCLSEFKILLLEGAPPFKGFKTDSHYGNRVSAINHGTVRLMKSIGAWPIIASTRYKPVKQMQVWDASSDALIAFNSDNFADDVAYIVENDLIIHAVSNELSSCPNVEVRNLSKIDAVKFIEEQNAKNWLVKMKDGEQIKCDLLIGADGANSLVRKEMNVTYYSQNYNQMGLVATLHLEDIGDGNNVAWQRFIPTGPVALLPLNETMSSLVWSTTPDHASQLQRMPQEEFVASLNQAFVKEYPKDSVVNYALSFLNTLTSSRTNIRQLPPRVKNVVEGSRACFPLGFGHASSYVNDNVALIGDAAHRVHPLAGQGVNLGFGDVECLTKVINETVNNGAKIGDAHYLLKYERERLMKNVPIMLGIHGIQNLYNTTFSPIVLLRSLGLQFTQNVPQLKKIFMDRAMG